MADKVKEVQESETAALQEARALSIQLEVCQAGLRHVRHVLPMAWRAHITTIPSLPPQTSTTTTTCTLPATAGAGRAGAEPGPASCRPAGRMAPGSPCCSFPVPGAGGQGQLGPDAAGTRGGQG